MHHNPAKNVLFVDVQPDAIARRLQLDEDFVSERIRESSRTLLEARANRPHLTLTRRSTLMERHDGLCTLGGVQGIGAGGVQEVGVEGH